MRSLLRRSIRPAVARLYRSHPIKNWPKWAADVLEVNTPATLPKKASLSPEGGANINIIFDLLDRTCAVPGNIAECGVFKGSSLCAIALHVKDRGIDKHVFGLDSFQGFDQSVRKDIELGGKANTEKRMGGFGETSIGHVRGKLARLGLLDAVTLIPGYFAETLQTLLTESFSFVHLDCDIYDSYKQTLNFFYPRMSHGGLILFDEYEDPPWPGCKLAVDEFFLDKREKPVAITMDNYEKYFIKKT
jgi:hypothetical protein